jgi:hypothetical protein
VHDSDSVACAPEAVLVGFAAALFPPGVEGEPASVQDTERFLASYCHARGRELGADELRQAWAAGLWTRAHDAKYQHAVGQPVTSLSEHDAHERLRRADIG